MHNFREAYKSAVSELQGVRMDAGRVQDELHHRRMAAARRKKTFMSVAATACVFLICGIGTVAAVNYSGSEIKIFNNGFSFTNQKSTADGNEGALPEAEAPVAAVGTDSAAAAAYSEGAARDRSADTGSAENAMGGGIRT